MGHSLSTIDKSTKLRNKCILLRLCHLCRYVDSSSSSPLSFNFVKSVLIPPFNLSNCYKKYHFPMRSNKIPSIEWLTHGIFLLGRFYALPFCPFYLRSANLCACAFIWARNRIYFERFLFNLIFSHILLSLFVPSMVMFASLRIWQRMKWSISFDFIDLSAPCPKLLSFKFAP